jgi:hypothetical protein
MKYPTYFEIGGEIIESQVFDSERHQDTTFDPLPGFTASGEFTDDEQMAIDVGEMVIQGLTGNEEYDAGRALRSYERLRRAKTVATWAIALAAADGPLPIGDTIAIVLLASYGIYETARAVDDIVQYGTW